MLNCFTRGTKPFIMVRVRGLEPPRIAALEPKSSVSTNSTILAHGAPTRTRTADLLITNQLLYQLSYRGINFYFYLSLWKMINIFWRRDRDSNPGNLAVQRFSRPPHSTTLPPLHIILAPQDGLEPPTQALTVPCSTTELLGNKTYTCMYF